MLPRMLVSRSCSRRVLLLRALALGDVLEGALHAPDHAVLVAHRLADRAHPGAPALRGQDLVLAVERRPSLMQAATAAVIPARCSGV